MNSIEEIQTYVRVIVKAVRMLTTELEYNIFDKLKEHHEHLSKETKLALKTLGSYGWYIPTLDHPITFPMEMAKELNNNNESYVNQEMMKVMQNFYTDIKKTILLNNPTRKKILLQAFEAHQTKKYALSVPVFLTQADGICKEVTEVGLYFKNKKKDIPLTRAYIDSMNNDSLSLSYLEPLRIVLPIIFSEKNTDESNRFNRHKILHGEDVSYDNELVSLKALALLSYIDTFLHCK
jgi:hypothetical protein